MNDLEVRIVDREGNVDIFTDVTHMKVGKTGLRFTEMMMHHSPSPQKLWQKSRLRKTADEKRPGGNTGSSFSLNLHFVL